MFQQHSNTFTPIRSTVGRAVPYRMDVQHSSIAVEQHGLVTEIKNRTQLKRPRPIQSYSGFGQKYATRHDWVETSLTGPILISPS